MSRNHLNINSRRWAATRRAVFERDGWRCVCCGAPGALECDHIVPLEQGGDPWDMANLQTLTRGCHIRKTKAENGKRRDLQRTDGELAWRALVDELR